MTTPPVSLVRPSDRTPDDTREHGAALEGYWDLI
jgi:hypothetical protein